MWSKAILDQSRGEVKKKKCQRRNGFSGLSDFAAGLVLRLPNQAAYRLCGVTMLTAGLLYTGKDEKAILKMVFFRKTLNCRKGVAWVGRI